MSVKDQISIPQLI